MVRLTSLARAALCERGITDVRAHVLLVRHRVSAKSVGTILVSTQPFSTEDLAAVEEVVGAMGFDLVLAPGSAGDPVFTAGAAGAPPPAGREAPAPRGGPPDARAPLFFYTLPPAPPPPPPPAPPAGVAGHTPAD